VGADAIPEFHWREHGRGEAVLLLHGLVGQVDHWEPTVHALGEVARAMALELPIFHPALPEASIPELVRYVLGFLDRRGISRAVVGGNSLGGHVALGLTLAHRDRVAGLILAGSSGLFERGFTQGVPHRPKAEWVRGKMEEIFFDPTFVTPAWVDQVTRIVTAPPSAMRVLRFARAAKRHNLEDLLPGICVPTLIVWGREDHITPPDVAERFHALIPDSTLVFLPRCGHAPMIERPQAFNLVVKAWLLETRLRRAPRPAMAGAA